MSILNLEVALNFKIVQTANNSEYSTLSASESSNTLRPFNIIYPEISRIPGTAAYLVVMWPQYDALGIWYILGNIIKSAAVGFGIFLLGRLIWVNFHHVTELFNKLLGLAGM